MKTILHSTKGLWLGFGLLALILVGGGGCGGSGGGTGQLSVSLGASEASSVSGSSAGLAAVSSKAGVPEDVEAVYVTIQEVQVHLSGSGEEDDDEAGEADDDSDEIAADENEDENGNNESGDSEDEGEGGGWITVATPNETFNLMDLKNCLLEKLGSAKLPAGQSVTQIRLILSPDATDGYPFANFVVIAGSALEIKVPSGFETGIKINPQEPVEIQEDGEVHVTLRIDLDKSLVFTGNGKILFKPVVLASVGGETADAFVSGRVTNDADDSAIAGAGISAQVTDSSLAAEDQVKVENATTTDADGNYRMCVAPGTYNVVATKDGFETAAKKTTVTGEETATVNFSLKALTANEGTVSGTATVSGGSADALIVLSFRQNVDIDGASAVIEVASVTVANGESYAVSLPAGEYDVVASTFGKTAVPYHVTVKSDEALTLDVLF